MHRLRRRHGPGRLLPTAEVQALLSSPLPWSSLQTNGAPVVTNAKTFDQRPPSLAHSGRTPPPASRKALHVGVTQPLLGHLTARQKAGLVPGNWIVLLRIWIDRGVLEVRNLPDALAFRHRE